MGLRRYSRKKGSLNLSINAIVVLILAITMLGLGLGFINNLFGGATEGIGDQLTAINDQELQQLEEEGVTQLTRNNVEMGKKESKTLHLAIKNDHNLAQNFGFNVQCFDERGNPCWSGGDGTPDAEVDGKINIRSAFGIDTEDALGRSKVFADGRAIPAEGLRVFPIVVSTKAGIPSGVYSFDIEITAETESKLLPMIVTVN